MAPRQPQRRPQAGRGKSAVSKWQRGAGAGARDVSRLLDPRPWTETDRFGTWNVRYISVQQARKTYTCPGCGRPIGVGTAHLVVWQADSFFGDAHAIEARRHWHRKCWSGR